MFVFRRTTNTQRKKYSYAQSPPSRGLQLHIKSPSSFLANAQFWTLMQYLTLGGRIVPWMSPAFFSSVKCCDTVALAMGSTSWISPKKQQLCDAKNFRIAMRAGCPNAFAKRATCSSCSVYAFSAMIFVFRSQNYERFLRNPTIFQKSTKTSCLFVPVAVFAHDHSRCREQPFSAHSHRTHRQNLRDLGIRPRGPTLRTYRPRAGNRNAPDRRWWKSECNPFRSG